MTETLNSAPIPLNDPIARPKRQEFGKRPDPLQGLMTVPWVSYFSALGAAIDASPERVASASKTDQSASIGATEISATHPTGLYRLSYYVRVTQAASTSSSIQVTLDWSDGGVAPSLSGAALTGNTTTTVQSGSIMILATANAPIRYSTTYSSVGATPMKYRLEVVLEEIKA